MHLCFFFFFNDTATTEIYTLSLHDALPISPHRACLEAPDGQLPSHAPHGSGHRRGGIRDRAHRSEEHTSELQSQSNLVCRLLLEKKNKPHRAQHSETQASRPVTNETHIPYF